jgi:outer membrane protein OmpA-like peptidoglycan-associated protein
MCKIIAIGFFVIITLLNSYKILAQVSIIDFNSPHLLKPQKLSIYQDGKVADFEGDNPALLKYGNVIIYNFADGFYQSEKINDTLWTAPQMTLKELSSDFPFISKENQSLFYWGLQEDGRIYYSSYIDNKFSTPIFLFGGYHPSLSSDEEYLFFIRHSTAIGGTPKRYIYTSKVYVSEKLAENKWSSPNVVVLPYKKIHDMQMLINQVLLLEDNKNMILLLSDYEVSQNINLIRKPCKLYRIEKDSSGAFSFISSLDYLNKNIPTGLISIPVIDTDKKKMYFSIHTNEGVLGKKITKPYQMYSFDLPISNPKAKSFEISNAIFQINSYHLNKGAIEEIDKIIRNIDSKSTIEISAHTDDIGAEDINQKLSQKRAESVVNYLIAKGIDKSRLVAKGYGESMPKVPNDTPQNRALNRRVEFRVIPTPSSANKKP